jgi:hypothetical protein
MTIPKGYDSSASATAASIFIIIVLAIPQLTAPIIISAYAQFALPEREPVPLEEENNNNSTTTTTTIAHAQDWEVIFVQQNQGVTNNATNNPVITELELYGGSNATANVTIPLSPNATQYQQSDPIFAKLVQLVRDCMNFTNEIIARPGAGKSMNLTDDNKKETCDSLITQGVDQFCQFGENINVAKCNEAREVTEFYLNLSAAIDLTKTM